MMTRGRYYYYFRRVLGLPVPWKRFVTQFQIIQFGTSLVCFVVTLKLLFIDKADCAGTRAMLFNLVFNVTLLYQYARIAQLSFLSPANRPCSQSLLTGRAASDGWRQVLRRPHAKEEGRVKVRKPARPRGG